MRLPELDQTTAHTLIHYLYTGKCQILSKDASSDAVIPESYRLGTCVYCAAIRYNLPGLAELAKNKIKSFNISVFDVLSVARDHAFSLLPEWDAWYPSYVEHVLNKAMAEDPEPFRKSDFISMIEGNRKLLRLVWETVLNNYARIPAAPVAGEGRATTPTPGLVSELAPSTSIEESGYETGNCPITPVKEPDLVQEPERVEQPVPAEEPVPVEESVLVPISIDDIGEPVFANASVVTESTQEVSLEVDGIESMA